MPITINNDPPGSRILTRQRGTEDDIDEEQIREWSPNGTFVKMRQRNGSEGWERKQFVDNRFIMRIADTPPIP